jgi:Skp family chaperone for outer membrane proteins
MRKTALLVVVLALANFTTAEADSWQEIGCVKASEGLGSR